MATVSMCAGVMSFPDSGGLRLGPGPAVDLEAGRGAGHPDWLTGFRLPAYAPDLNPVEGARAGMKADLGNLPAPPPAQPAAARQRLGRISATLCLSPDFSARPNSPSNLNRHSNQT